VPRLPELHDLLSGPVLEVAPRLLGSVLRQGEVACRITEVEAYDGSGDPGSHAFRGPTPRNAVMFGPPGHLYVYFTYGMHFCCNVVCGPEGTASAVLLRAGQVVDGLEVARERRPAARHDRDLARGPARLALAAEPVGRVLTGPRVGLRHAADRPWRFWVADDPTVSTYRPAVRRTTGS
jgi:DNA-3-methyladenine glycosylase